METKKKGRKIWIKLLQTELNILKICAVITFHMNTERVYTSETRE
jgi:hypothetical protein